MRESFFTAAYFLFNRVPRITKQQGGLRVLVYHGIVKKNPGKFNSRFLSEKQFEKHLIAIKDCYNPISLEDFKAGRFSKSKLNILVTFDDGLKNNFSYAAPLLVKYNIPAVFFVTALQNRRHYLFNDLLDVFSCIGPAKIRINNIEFVKRRNWRYRRYSNIHNVSLAKFFHALNITEREKVIRKIFEYTSKHEFERTPEYLELLNEDEIRQLGSEKIFSIGSHGVSHTDFSFVNSSELDYELEFSRQTIESITKKTCDAVAFPYGNYTADTLTLCKEAGYNYLFGTEKINNKSERTLVIERLTVNPFVSAINQMYYIAKNGYD